MKLAQILLLTTVTAFSGCLKGPYVLAASKFSWYMLLLLIYVQLCFTLNGDLHFGFFVSAYIIRSLIPWKKSEALDILGMGGKS